jgi:hypothetical protein
MPKIQPHSTNLHGRWVVVVFTSKQRTKTRYVKVVFKKIYETMKNGFTATQRHAMQGAKEKEPKYPLTITENRTNMQE